MTPDDKKRLEEIEATFKRAHAANYRQGPARFNQGQISIILNDGFWLIQKVRECLVRTLGVPPEVLGINKTSNKATIKNDDK